MDINPSEDIVDTPQELDAATQVQLFKEFFDAHYLAKLLEKARKKQHYIEIDFALLSKFEPQLSDLLLDHPDEVLKAAEIAIEQFDLPSETKRFTIRIHNLPRSRYMKIRDIRSKDLNKLIWMEGVVRQKSEVRPQVSSARFECPSCGNVLSVIQLEKKFKEPTRCSCGRKGKFRVLSKELIDAQSISLEESPDDIEGGEQPKRMNVLLKNDLVSPLSEKITNPGSKIVIAGQVKEVPIVLREGGQSTRFDLIIEGNSLESTEEEFGDLIVTKEEEEHIKKLSQDPKIWDKMIEGVAPSIYGHDRIKEALLLQQMGGVRKVRDDGVVTRGDMHIMIIGDPGGGKSQMLKRIMKIAPKSRYVSGKGVSGAGLSAAVVKDEFLQGWTLEAGALVLANKGTLCVDELDKMDKEDSSSMHEALEQQTITISKANIQAVLRCETTVLAAANPKYGRFDPYATVAEQINLPSSLINRFDLIFPLKDLPDETKDSQLAEFVLRLHQKQNVDEPDIPTELMRKYIAYAKKIVPKLSDAAVDELKAYYIKMRSMGGDGAKSIPISARQLEGLVRMTEAVARLRLSTSASQKDAQRAIDLLDFCLKQVAYDEETGTFDIDRIATDIPAKQRNKILVVKEILTELENDIGKIIPIEDVVKKAIEKGYEKEEIEEVIQKLRKSGDVYEPRRGFLSKI